MERVECDVCFHQYDEEERHPRTLACGHTLCSVCIIDGITDSQLKCPFCRELHNVAAPSDIPVSFALLKVVRAIAAGGTDPQQSTSEKTPSAAVSIRSPLEPEVHAGICAEHGSYRLFWCLKCQLWVCRDCTVVEHPSGTCSVIAIKQALDRIKKEEENLVNQTGKSKNTFINHLNEYQTKLCENDKKHDEQLEAVQEVTEKQKEVKCLLQKENKRVTACLNEVHQAFEKMMASCNKMAEDKTVEGITTERHACQRCRRDLESMINLSQEELAKADALKISGELQNIMQLALEVAGYQTDTLNMSSLSLLSSMSDKVFKLQDCPTMLTIKDLHIFVSLTPLWTTMDDSSMGALITMESGKLYLHALRKASPPPNAFVVPYSHIQSLVRTPHEVFFNMSWDGEVKGQVCIQMQNENDLTESFLKRCSGEAPVSFVNSKMVEVINKNRNSWDRLCGGGDGSATCDVVENIGALSTVTRENTKNWVTLCEVNGFAGFCVWLKNTTYVMQAQTQRVTLGRLTKGLDICLLAANYHNIKEVTINDCGLLIE